MNKEKHDTYRCAVCGSDDVEAQHWVHLNEETIGEPVYDDLDNGFWCNDCRDAIANIYTGPRKPEHSNT